MNDAYKQQACTPSNMVVWIDLLNVLRPPFCTLNTHSWLNWVDEDEDEDEVGLKEKPEDTRYTETIWSNMVV